MIRTPGIHLAFGGYGKHMVAACFNVNYVSLKVTGEIQWYSMALSGYSHLAQSEQSFHTGAHWIEPAILSDKETTVTDANHLYHTLLKRRVISKAFSCID
jgi:hypothetical protein